MSNRVPAEYHSRFTLDMPAQAPALLLAGGACLLLAFLFGRARWARWAVLAGVALIALGLLL